MKRSRFSDEQIIEILKEQEAGAVTAGVCRRHGISENMNGAVWLVCRTVKHWRDAAMARRWTGAAMLEAAKGFRRLMAHRQLPIRKAALAAHGARHTIKPVLERKTSAA